MDCKSLSWKWPIFQTETDKKRLSVMASKGLQNRCSTTELTRLCATFLTVRTILPAATPSQHKNFGNRKRGSRGRSAQKRPNSAARQRPGD